MKKARTAAFIGVILISALVILTYFFGPYSETILTCPICGKAKVIKTRIGITYCSKETETSSSRWYKDKGLKPHNHNWKFRSSFERSWGVRIYSDGAFSIYPLGLLQGAEMVVDPNTFEELVEEYYFIQEDEAKKEDFIRRCEEITGLK